MSTNTTQPVPKNGNPISIDALTRKLNPGIPDSEIASRLAKWKQPKPRYTKGVLAKYAKLVFTASEGAVTDAGL